VCREDPAHAKLRPIMFSVGRIPVRKAGSRPWIASSFVAHISIIFAVRIIGTSIVNHFLVGIAEFLFLVRGRDLNTRLGFFEICKFGYGRSGTSSSSQSDRSYRVWTFTAAISGSTSAKLLWQVVVLQV
jgi:hypothetical protein